MGFYALAAVSVERSAAPGRIRRNTPDPVPVILLLRLVVDRKEQGKGLGKNLLRDAISRVVQTADLVGVRAMPVHARHDDGRACSSHFDFEPTSTDPLHPLLLIKDARALIAGAYGQ